MTKHYKSDVQISVNIILDSGKNKHIPFIPLSNGSSVYSTDDTDIQSALERHYRFGKLFKLDKVEEPAKAVEVPTESQEATIRTVSVSDIGEAKDYLAENFGLNRTSLRSEKSILAAAAANGIHFDGI